MKNLKNIFFVFTAVLILLPAAVSFSHIFSGHTHKLCDNYAQHHYHAKSLDCDLHKFNKNPALQIDFAEYILIPEQSEEKQIFNYYRFLNDYEALPFDLRGPPSVA